MRVPTQRRQPAQEAFDILILAVLCACCTLGALGLVFSVAAALTGGSTPGSWLSLIFALSLGSFFVVLLLGLVEMVRRR